VGARGKSGRAPAQVRARPSDARAPTGKQRLIDRDAVGLELRPGAAEEKVRARQTPRGVKRESGLGVQSAASGA
jgi:hypothetical protein